MISLANEVTLRFLFLMEREVKVKKSLPLDGNFSVLQYTVQYVQKILAIGFLVLTSAKVGHMLKSSVILFAAPKEPQVE